tara:strand:+ start:11 stop:988 length:978 start_codon:yes stop_codon:yes gene_type:complete
MKSFFTIFLILPFLVNAQIKCVSGDCVNGKGYWKDISGFVYNGEFKNGEITGYGILTYSKSYNNGDEVGKSYMHYSDAISYEGYLENSLPQGKGKIIFKDDFKMEGEFEDGKLISGKIFQPKEIGYILIGDFIDNQLKSPGTMEFYNGNKYVGDIKNNLPNGKGTMFYPTKSKDVGYWEDGNFLTGNQLEEFDIINLKKDGNSYLIDVKLNGVPVNNMIFDTGAEMISISASYLGALVENGTISESDIIGDMNFRNASGEINPHLVINIKEVIIGSEKITNVHASVCEECILKGVNLLGLNAIKGLGNIYLDFEKDRIILNKRVE